MNACRIFRITIVCVLLLIAGLIFSESVWAKQQDIKILSMDDYGLSLELTLPPFQIEEIQGPDGTCQRIRIKDWAKTSMAGYPELPLKGILIQAPLNGEIDAQVVKNVYESLSDCEICPVPKRVVSDEGEIALEFTRDNDAYQSSEFFPGSLVKVGSRAILRDVPVARIKIHPFQWNPATRELRCYKKIRLKVKFESGVRSQESGVGCRRSDVGGQRTEDPSEGRRAGRGQKSEVGGGVYEKLKNQVIINYKNRNYQSLAQTGTMGTDINAKALAPGRAARATMGKQELSINNQQEALKIEIKQDGIYRLTYDDLAGAGVDPGSVDPGTFQLFNSGTEAAIKVVSGDTFGPGDYMEFYGKGIDNQFTGTNVYWLYWGKAPGMRITQIDGSVTGQGKKLDSFYDSLHVEENHTLWESMPGAPEEDYWFWEKLTAPATSEYSINIPSPASDQGEATVRICFRGRSTASPHPNHHTIIFLNGTEIGSATWDGDGEYVQEMTISPGLINDGANTLGIQSPGDTGAAVDIIYYNWIEIDYWRYFEAVEDKLTFTVNGDEKLQIEIKKLGQEEIRIYDITDPDEVKEVVNFSIQPDGPSYKAIFEDQVAGARTYYVLSDGRIRQPENPTLWQSANLESHANGADWIVITARDFLASVEPLRLLRENQGLRVKVVSIEDVYNEFNYGLIDPKAIKGFLQCAYANWEQPAPVYVFLVGDANMDYRDYWESGKQNIIPPHLCHTDLGVTPEDNWYVCMDGPGDVLPDMFIGRIPASSAAMAAAEINKITGFENSTWPAPEKVLLAADNNEMAFEDLNEALVPYLPPEFGVDRVYLRLYASVADATQDIISSIDQGMMVTNYVGHGSVTNWAGEYMFDSGDIPALTNSDRLTFVIAMTCLNGYFSHPLYYCLAEEFVAAEGKGAIGAFAPSGLGYVWEHEILNPELFSILFDQKNSILGSLTTGAKIAAYAQGVTEDTMRTFTLFGDPACRLKGIWQNGDIDGNGSVGLEDAIIVFKILAGIKISQFINMSADVNNDGRIGLAEAVYVLQHVAGARP